MVKKVTFVKSVMGQPKRIATRLTPFKKKPLTNNNQRMRNQNRFHQCSLAQNWVNGTIKSSVEYLQEKNNL